MTTPSMTPPPPTDLIHLSYQGNFQLDCDAEVVFCQMLEPSTNEDEPHKDLLPPTTIQITLDRTTMHPQGGGQPTDIGTISFHKRNEAEVVVEISKVLIDRASGVVTHTGTVLGCTPTVYDYSVGDRVLVSVDAARRRILSECHTAGHVVDSAMARCDRILPPTKGYHFLDGPYVEYKGSIPVEERASLLAKLKAAFAQLVEEDIATEIQTLSKADAEQLCDKFPSNVDLGGEQDVRIVTVAGWSCPCGGTHVKTTADLKERGWGITGIKSKKGVVRIKYGAPGLKA